MKSLKHISILILMFCSFNGRTQVVADFLFSKMDVAPQYTLWDNTQTMLMGFTKTLGGNIDLPSPTLVFNEGDSIELSMTNFSQAAPHTVHLHGLDVNQANDGVPHLSYYIPHDSTGVYSFVAPHAGTYLYHCHVLSTLHVQAGMYGMVIIRPPDGSNTTWDGGYAFDQEIPWLFSEIDTAWHTNAVINDPYDAGASTHSILDFKPDYFLINGKSDSQLGTQGIEINGSANDMIYMRLANIGFCGNRVIFPSDLNSQIIDSDGRPLPSVINSDTVDLMPGERYGVMLNPTTEFSDLVYVEYFDLNTMNVKNVQQAVVTIQGFNEISENGNARLSVFPNPANEDVTLNFSNFTEEQGLLQITDLNGKIIYQKHLQLGSNWNETLNTSQLSNGIYLVSYSSEKRTLTNKLIVKH